MRDLLDPRPLLGVPALFNPLHPGACFSHHEAYEAWMARGLQPTELELDFAGVRLQREAPWMCSSWRGSAQNAEELTRLFTCDPEQPRLSGHEPPGSSENKEDHGERRQ